MSNKDMKGKEPQRKGGGRREKDGAAGAGGEQLSFFPTVLKKTASKKNLAFSTNTKKAQGIVQTSPSP